MPRYTPSEDELDSSYQQGAAVKPPATPAEPEEEAEETGKEEQTALVANTILSPGGEPLKAGDQIIVRIVKNYGDESEIAYGKPTGSSETEEPSSTETEIRALETEKGM